MRVYNTCVDATDLLADVKDVLALTATGQTRTFDEDLRNRLVKETLDEIQSGRINGYGFEDLVASLLKSLGAKDVRVIRPRTIDKGADIIATFVTANTFSFTLAVQAKHYQRDPPVGKEAVEELIKGMEAEGADLGWVATCGSFSSEAVAYKEQVQEQEGKRIELVDGDDLASLIVENGLKPGARLVITP